MNNERCENNESRREKENEGSGSRESRKENKEKARGGTMRTREESLVKNNEYGAKRKGMRRRHRRLYCQLQRREIKGVYAGDILPCS